MASYWNTPSYSQPTAEELRRRVKNSKKAASARGKKLHPIAASGRNIVTSWWGRAWCENLERYADFDNRLDRGKRYIRSGALLDLQISKGKVSARVQGSRRTPYKVEIRISPLNEKNCDKIIRACGSRIQNLEELVSGSFPEDLKQLFQEKGGLFPSSREISFDCSCPDWALLCKHVAAALYGIGVRLDEDPLLFFELRGIDPGRFIDVTIRDRIERMLQNADTPSSRIIDDAEVHGLFGVI